MRQILIDSILTSQVPILSSLTSKGTYLFSNFPEGSLNTGGFLIIKEEDAALFIRVNKILGGIEEVTVFLPSARSFCFYI